MSAIPPGPAGALHAVLALGVEIAALVAAVRAGLALQGGGWAGWATGLVLMAAVIGAWALWGAPTSATRLTGTALLGFKGAVFLFAAGGFLIADGWGVAVIFAAVAILHVTLALALDAL
ncbi:hypothetical protein OB2597_02977 [Pseudooceanicola batsensis HTCC2597]|uniref:DUF2568 domain-containing protein n=1 Tax=Pseudooceanicola batsensis (strain ATCC BAA-863 / DSM 15984 / KCTC 12145 / HTCC2597) TaxID=252305 RepID=A3TXI9_PSEBH|nr:DUF2568 domain-containing protein [Pseudooceanicola batsensis]EAQ03549.1 hypothetical protein OB2597_02977 [Pseudooceanicola batsensis HTCC2597]